MLSPDAEWRLLASDEAWRRRATVALLVLAAYGLVLLVFREGLVLERLLGRVYSWKAYGPGSNQYTGGWQVWAEGVRAVSAGLRYVLASGAGLLLVRGDGPMRPTLQAARLAGIALAVAAAVGVGAWLGV